MNFHKSTLEKSTFKLHFKYSIFSIFIFITFKFNLITPLFKYIF